MSENVTNESNPEQTSPFVIHVQYLKDLSFENPNPLAHLTDKEEHKPEISINVQVNAKHLADNMFEVLLEINANTQRAKEVMFICQVQYAALVSLQVPENSEDSVLRKILLEDCPQIIFPFARNIIADTTRDSGFPPLLLQPVNFAALNQSQQNKPPETGNEPIH
jgi:preprotein translocase subunit SecB